MKISFYCNLEKLIKIIILFIIYLLIINPVHASTLDDLYKQKQDLQNTINSTKQEIKSLQDAINSLEAQEVATQKEINITSQIISGKQEEIAQTQAQIAIKTEELKTQKANLYETMRVYYETSSPSTLEVLVGSNSLSEAIDKTQYLESVSNNLNSAIEKITKTMNELEVQNKNLEEQKSGLESQKASLIDQQRNLSIQAQGKEQLLKQASNRQYQLKADLDNVSESIYAERQKLGGYSTGGTGGYPFAGASVSGVDPWGFYYRQCTSYAAWYFNAVEGKSWKSFRWLGVDRSSNGGDWADLGAYQGYSVSSTPRSGAIVSWPAGGLFGAYGHVAIVQSVNSNGTINVSEYNWAPYSYSERSNVSTSGARFIY